MKFHQVLCQKGKLMTRGAQYWVGVPIIVSLLQEEVMDMFGYGTFPEVKNHNNIKFLYAKQLVVLLLTHREIC